MAPSLSIDHMAVSVPDLEQAVDFYTQVCGFQMFANIDTEQLKAHGMDIAVNKVYGPTCQRFKAAYLSARNGIAFEIFEFQDPAYQGPKSPPEDGIQPIHYTRGGFFHIACVTEDVKALLAKAEDRGAKRIGDFFEPVPGQICAYMWDPWGNAIEVMSCGLRELAVKALGASEGKHDV